MNAGNKTWAAFKVHFQHAYRGMRNTVNTAKQGGYTATAKNIYGMQSTTYTSHELDDFLDQKAETEISVNEIYQANTRMTKHNATMRAHMAGMKKIMENMQTQLSKLAKTGVTNIKNTNTIGGEDNRTNTDKKY